MARNVPALLTGAARPIDVRLGQLAARYWASVSAHWTPAWRAEAARLLRLILDGLGSDRPVQSIRPEDVEVWWGRVQARYCNPETQAKILARVRHLFRTARRWGHLDEDPTAGLRAARKGRGRVVWFTPEQRELILAHANERLRPYCYVGAFTGARRGSMLALRKGDVDLAENTLTFRRTKNGEDHVVPMHPRLREVLAPLAVGDPHAPLLYPYSPMGLTQAFKRLLRRLGLPQARMNVAIHALRHDFGSRLGMAGANTATIMAAGGWRDPRVAARYTHLDRAAVSRALLAAL